MNGVADSVGSWLVFAPQRLPALLVFLAGDGVLGGAENGEPEADGPPEGPGPPGGPLVNSSFLISLTIVIDCLLILFLTRSTASRRARLR